MRKKLLFFAITTLFSIISIAQEQPKFGIIFNGFVKTDVIWDSRQTVAIREGHFLLYPMNEQLDNNGDDINAKANFNMLSIQTRLRGNITGPDALGAKTSGAIEGEFFGHSDADVNGFRLRHAYVQLNWAKTELMIGQNWHPMFATNCFPDVVSFNTGAPFLPFTRNPQIRLTQQFNDFKIMLSAVSQRDFVSNGPDGPNSKYLRNSSVPDLNLRMEYEKKNNENGTTFLAGVSGNYKILTPQLVTAKNYKTDANANSAAGMVYLKLVIPEISIKSGFIYAQDAHDLTMIGGYAVENITDTLTGFVEYAPVGTMSGWIDINTNNKVWQVGLFGGYSKNLGARTDLVGPYYSRGANIDYLYRVSPRFIYNSGKFRFAPEIEYTVAAYGKTQKDGTVDESKEIGNFRFLLGIYFFF
jgi:hypothetical protein